MKISIKSRLYICLLLQGGIHKLRLQEEGGRWSKSQNLVNVVCERPPTWNLIQTIMIFPPGPPSPFPQNYLQRSVILLSFDENSMLSAE